ncbi:MAG: tetratricopeptide repeat protein [Proteobacteria bacterium]|nr:tetratricopeptide repeat protein [Pseudomonadota bacterium]
MTVASVLLTLALLACAAMLSVGGQLIKWSPRRTPFSRGAFFLSIIIGVLAIMIPGAVRSELQARSPAAPLGEVAEESLSGGDGPLPGVEYLIPPVLSMPREMGGNEGHRRVTSLSLVGATSEPKWSLIIERAEQLRSQGDYAQAADTYAEVLVSAGGHLGARLGLAKALLEFGRYKEAELHVGRASAIARQAAGSPPDLALAFSAVAEIREEFESRLSGPLTAVQRQRLSASEQVRLTAIRKASPWRITINVTDVREELGELVVEGTLTSDPALRIVVHSEDRSHVQRRIGEKLAMTIVLTRWPSGREAFDAREVPPG